jgi:NADPH-dependent 2,4-dienoyl-CoA reductase/sulfur reductase-like enzyme/rhodanese-related sulfurtransferase
MKKKKIIVIGGSAAGPKSAAKARRLDENAEITILQKEPDLSMATCGYPYYVGGIFDDRNMLLATPTGVVRDSNFFMNAKAINARVEVEVTAIDKENHTVTCKDLKSGNIETLEYDKLVICTGSKAKRPPIPGIDFDGVTTLQSMSDADYLRKIRDEKKVKKAVVIGGGLIGVEACEALQISGIEVTVVELLPQILLFLDIELAKIVENYMHSNAVNVITDNGIAEFLGENNKLTGVKLQDGTELSCELAVLAIGVQPNSELAANAGLTIGKWGGIVVNEHMQTSDPDIYAAGDCVEIVNRITKEKVFVPMGDLANLQGRVVGENIINNDVATFPGSIQTGICKIFEFSVGSTGLSEKAAKSFGYTDIETVINASPDKPGYMEAKLLISKMLVDKNTRTILGYQSVGEGDVSKQLATAAIAIQGKLTVDDISNADLPYAPPFSLAIDHFVASAHIMENKLKGRMIGISTKEVYEKLNSPDAPFLLDLRSPDEYEEMRLGVGETLIPLGALRKRLDKLPKDKNKEIICYCKISLRGYEGALVLRANGWNNAKVMEGGIVAWPYQRER